MFSCALYVCILKCGHLERCKRRKTARFISADMWKGALVGRMVQGTPSLTTKSSTLLWREVEGRSLDHEIRSSKRSCTLWSCLSRIILSTDFFHLMKFVSKRHFWNWLAKMRFQNQGADLTLNMLKWMLMIQLCWNTQTYFIKCTHL